jgi:threonine dehydrogenase-like Zn-dependent dehydrogenase
VIHSLGSAVTGFTEGQRVAVNAVTPCYRCSYCQRGFTSQCGGALGGYKYTVQTFMALAGRPWMDETRGAAR